MKPSKTEVCRFLVVVGLVGLPAVAYAANLVAERDDAAVTVPVASRAKDSSKCSRQGRESRKLSTGELEKMASLKDQLLASTGPQTTQLRLLERQLREQLAKQNIDKDQVMQTQSRINALRDQLSNARLSYRLDMMSILTPEQKEQVQRRLLVSNAFGGFRHHRRHCKESGERAVARS